MEMDNKFDSHWDGGSALLFNITQWLRQYHNAIPWIGTAVLEVFWFHDLIYGDNTDFVGLFGEGSEKKSLMYPKKRKRINKQEML